MDALHGLTVLDCSSHIAGPYTTKLLADLGARVIKIERPGGDPARTLGPWLDDEPGLERSGTYQFLNTNKESIVIDLKRDASRQVLRGLVERADLVLLAYAPATAGRLGLTYESLREWKDIPVLSMTNFGFSGPYRDYRLSETVLYAMGGEMWSHGTLDREPLKLGGTAALLQCGAMGAIAALGAVHAFEVHGIGQHVDLPLFDVQVNGVDRRSSAILAYRWSGRLNSRPPGSSAGLAGGIYPCADGYVEVTASFGNYWNRFADMVGDPLLLDPKWSNPAIAFDPAAKEEADGVIYPWMLSRTRREIWAEARRARALVAPLFTGRDLYEDPVFRERGLWTEVEHATLGTFPMLGRPYHLSETPWHIRSAAPRLGEHTRPILEELGYDGAAIDALYKEGAVA
ncbi:MAG: CoA transferase [Dehalococcoidia bacterium]|nr:CoA transferase [Dehalococcoidia bacterium]